MKLILNTLLLIASSSLLYAQPWLQSGVLSPEGVQQNSVASNALASHNGYLYSVGTGYDGIYMSADNGTFWQILDQENNGIPNGSSVNYSVALSHDNRIYVGQTSNQNGDIYYSENDGASWVADTSGLPKGINGNGRLHVFEMIAHDDYIYIRLDGVNNLYRKKALDASWEKVTGQIPSNLISYNGKLFGNSGSGLTFSTDGGFNWTTPANAGIPLNAFGFGPVSTNGLIEFNGKFYTGTTDFFSTPNNRGVYSSSDEGATWVKAGNTNGTNSFYNFAKTSTDLYAFGGTNFTASLIFEFDGDTTWQDISEGLANHHTVSTLQEHNNEVFLGTTAHGVWKNGNIVSSTSKPLSSLITFFPNPAKEVLTVHLPNLDQLIKVNAINTTGRSFDLHTWESTVDVSNLEKGVYQLELNASSGDVYSVRFIKE